ncbi:alkaline phosphatase family protein [Nocardia halotolerans]|uniref:Alkaline phosphatase family protein n=1 Tax=Nocardia halotolerans TaxID=1755878 RepID=A0ABV8VCX5_9NOCA
MLQISPSTGARAGRRTVLGVAAFVLASLAVSAPVAADPATDKVVVIGIDGTLWSEVLAADAPALRRLAAEGTLSRTSIAPHTTMSCPSWATALTGVWDSKHGITDNGSSCNPAVFDTYPTVFTQIERAAPQLRTASIGTWNTIGMIAGGGSPSADRVVSTQLDPSGAGVCESAADTTAATLVAEAIEEDGPDLVFTHLDQVDIAGHTLRGTWPQAYRDAITRVDELVDDITSAVDARAAAHPGERWTVLVTTDHGHRPDGGHGGSSDYENASFVIARGPGFAPGREYNGYALADITPTVLDLLDLPVAPNLDGLSMRAGGSGDPDAIPARTPVVDSPITGSSSGSAAAAAVNNPLCALVSGSAGTGSGR